MVKSPRLFLIGTSLVLLVGARSTQAAETKIVSPGDYEFREGEGGGDDDGALAPYRYQVMFPAADFAALGNRPHWVIDTTFRPDQSLTSPRTVYQPDNEYRLTTTQVSPDNLSLRFDDNLGSDFKQFYRGPVTLVADVAGSGPGPREFYDADRPAGVTPYLYDPSQGNLLMDVIGWQGSPSHSGDQVYGIQSKSLVGSPNATHGDRIPLFVHQLTFIPVIPGDYNVSGAVDQGDLDLVLLNWGADAAAVPESWVNDLPSGIIDQDELDGVLLNWGAGGAVVAASGAVPEPGGVLLVLIALATAISMRRRM